MYLEISNPMDYHVALYIRLSKEDENEGSSESVNNQKSLLDDFVKKHRLSVYDTYIDDGWSGTNFDRPDFQRMIGDIEAKKNFLTEVEENLPAAHAVRTDMPDASVMSRFTGTLERSSSPETRK